MKWFCSLALAVLTVASLPGVPAFAAGPGTDKNSTMPAPFFTLKNEKASANAKMPAPQVSSPVMSGGSPKPPVMQESAAAKWKAATGQINVTPSSSPALAAAQNQPAKPVEPAVQQMPNQGKPTPLPVGEIVPVPMSPAVVGGLPDEIQKFKTVVMDSKKQVIHPDKREFASISRNYVNRITCAGKIEKLLAPQDQALEAEITNDGRDLFLRIGANPHKQFPLDMSFICDGHVFLVNAVVHPEVPSQELVLALPKGARPLSAPNRERYAEAINNASGLPLEEKLAKVVKRVYQGDFLPYWTEIETPTSASKWSRGSYSVLLQKVVRTHIDGMVGWDFVFRGTFPKGSYYDEIRKIVRGEIIAFGRVNYEGLGATRIVVITREDVKMATASAEVE